MLTPLNVSFTDGGFKRMSESFEAARNNGPASFAAKSFC